MPGVHCRLFDMCLHASMHSNHPESGSTCTPSKHPCTHLACTLPQPLCTDLLRAKLSSAACVLDLCSSWTSHLPPELHLERVVGHGLNAQELAANVALHSSFVQVRPDLQE